MRGLIPSWSAISASSRDKARRRRTSSSRSVRGFGAGPGRPISTESRLWIFSATSLARVSSINSVMSSANVRLPDKVELVEVKGLSTKSEDIYGGLNISCTSGFSVKDSHNTKGITTAGHCSDDLSYNGTDLDYESGEFNESYDIQWHTAPGFTVRNLVHFGHTYPRYIYGTVSASDQSVDDYVCKYGRVTGYHCGYITHVDYTPTYSGSDPACHPNSDCDWKDTWIRFAKSGSDICEPGDSGGPVVLGNDAYGTHAFCIGSGNTDSLYMPVDYIDDLGLTVLTD